MFGIPNPTTSPDQPNEPIQPAFDSLRQPSVPYTQSGSLYGAARCRDRPLYPRFGEKADLNHSDEQQSSGDGPGPCRKFFSDYVSQRQTGGIMALWCRHLVCVGFHIIPKCEGRNDVFSAVFTHWPKPPDTIIYDFACQLAPYSLAREPAFFKNVLFVVDQMHQHGHATCTTSSFLSTYMNTNPELQNINSSAAECGNAGLSRIKKSVSYCSQEHAMLLIKQFLGVWNRRRMRAMLKE
ncbi:unnamed protein product [Tilletia laevis]|uniref:Uncharacterized protein n=3 Tax=Tilletia TaxID=13289 RepID=A0A8X7MNK5_9BASI|nr:hypothetical protein CF335_g8876 [Tilletia laevis]KAE8182237.1 hypothetical protein CF328_g8577 [Tilletia controversa]KAE8245836.1 hypothetical protein A4X03_0g7405 [Tilletia caries]KAE8182874.1 hypothetical protein CF336_g8381 [Tilletia laevis]KAE8243112.1 hypothetical protein A4X06_0g6545 [Tilletia controversa]